MKKLGNTIQLLNKAVKQKKWPEVKKITTSLLKKQKIVKNIDSNFTISFLDIIAADKDRNIKFHNTIPHLIHNLNKLSENDTVKTK